ncbi:hypothetical protein [Polyangium aurulentum]|uniref:hypothetical protein n=1 Tax=Polyangium aurulentum TaxID=2567896 RepID=UPI001F22EF86|nr:hypothetical protein [Polyangium aurulentum]
MELGRLLQELIAAARKADITVRAEPFDPGLSEKGTKWRGGLCVVRGQRIILLDERAPLVDRIATLAASLASVDLEHVFMPPIVRATIGAYGREATARPLPNLTEPRPPVRARRRAPVGGDQE